MLLHRIIDWIVQRANARAFEIVVVAAIEQKAKCQALAYRDILLSHRRQRRRRVIAVVFAAGAQTGD